MADPVIPDIFKAQVVFKGASNLPEDVFVNNFYFRNSDNLNPFSTLPDAIQAVLSSFYTGTTPAAGTVASYLSPKIQRLAEIRIYDLGQAPPREPTLRNFTLPAQTGDVLPAEVACVLTFHGPRNLPRQRGRVFIGPLRTAVLDQTPPTDVRLSMTALPAALRDRAAMMASTTQNVDWVVVSQVGAVATVVERGWVDNAFDTQRRRGQKPNVRALWP